MRRFSLLLSVLMIVSMLLAACGAEETSTTVPSTDIPPVTLEATMTEEATAETPSTDLTTTPVVPVTGEDSPSRVSNLLDYDIWNQNGEQIGEVEDMVLDLDNLKVSYVVIETGGFLDIGDKTLLIPWESLELQTPVTGGQENAFVLNVDQEMLNNAPDVDLSTVLPALGESAGEWDADIRNFWQNGTVPSATDTGNVTPATDTTAVPEMTATTTTELATSTAESTGAGTGNGVGQGQQLQGVVLASEVLGSSITIGGGQSNRTTTDQATATAPADSSTAMPTDMTATPATGVGTDTGPGLGTENQGPTDGTIEDMIVEVDSGDIQYLVINASFTDGERWIPVPLGFLQWDATNDSFLLRVDANALQSAPFFQGDQFPDTSMEGWDTDFSDFWQNNTGSGGVTIATATP